MPKNVAQWTGMVVTMIVVLGRDQDLFTAAPLGVCACILATLFAMSGHERSRARGAAQPAKLPRPKRRHFPIAPSDVPR